MGKKSAQDTGGSTQMATYLVHEMDVIPKLSPNRQASKIFMKQ